MPTWFWVLLVVLLLAALAVAGWLVMRRRRRTEELRTRFGPEYDRAISERGGRASAEAELEAREKRRSELEIRPLTSEARERYREAWRKVQERFVDEPGDAVGEADHLVTDVMRDRGYPMDDFEQRAADVSVDHPDVVENYRAAHRISEASERGDATTEDLRQAMRHYRALFEDLLETRSGEPVENTNSQTRSV